MKYHFRNLIFEGGGVRGIAYIGAMKVLEKKKILSSIIRVGGASVGAINALLLGLNYSSEEAEKILMKMDIINFLDFPCIVKIIYRINKEFGLCKGNKFYNWISNFIEEKTDNPNSTFKDVYRQKEDKGFRDMYFIGTNLSTGFAEVFSYEHSPTKRVADAVRISMSYPIVFTAKKNSRGDVYIDGGLLNNYPIRLFDRKKYITSAGYFEEPKYYKNYNIVLEKDKRNTNHFSYNKETLGFRLDSAKEIAIFRDQAEPVSYDINNFPSYIVRFVSTILNINNSMHLNDYDWDRSIYIDTLDVGTLDFNINESKKKDLIESGKNCTENYFKWFDNPDKSPANRP